VSVAPTPTDGISLPDQYEIRVASHLHPRWDASFEGFELIRDSDGTTILRGPIVDQASLHGVLRKVRDLGVVLISVTSTPDGGGTAQPADLPAPDPRDTPPA
jgi:hypothetical protein